MSALADTLKYVELGELAFAKASRAEAVKELAALRLRVAELEAALQIYAKRQNWQYQTNRGAYVEASQGKYTFALWRYDHVGYEVAENALKGGEQ